MPTFRYHALTPEGRRERGAVTAGSPKLARAQLRQQGLRVTALRTRRSPAQDGIFSGNAMRHRARWTLACRELATLLAAGIPLLQSLDTLLMESRGDFRECLVGLRDKVAMGSSLADAMATERSVFDEMTIGMVRVGEHAGNLDHVFEQLAEFRERQNELADRVLTAILYPALVGLVSIIVTIFLMTAVVPMLLSNLEEMDRPLPWPTRILKTLSDFLLDNGWLLAIAVAMCCVVAIAALRTHTGRRATAQLTLRVPVLKTLVQRQVLSRTALIVASLLRSGVELVEALQIAERSASNILLKEGLSEMCEKIESGRTLSDSMSEHAIFTPALRQVFLLGQQSGKLDSLLEQIGRDYDRQAAVLAGRLAALLEPILIVNLAVVVGFILFATVLPILEAGNVMAP